MAKRVSDDLIVPTQPLDPVASREERRATGRMVALMVAFILILSVLYQAWIRKIPVLAGVTIPALIMIMYGGWVLFLAKKDKKRRLNAENSLRADSIALSEVACMSPTLRVTKPSAPLDEEVKASKKMKPKGPKNKTDSENFEKKQEVIFPQTAVSVCDSDMKLSRSLSSYN